MREYLEFQKCRVGPGGIGCPCCSPMHTHPRKSKPLMRRIVRRVKKAQLKKDMRGAA